MPQRLGPALQRVQEELRLPKEAMLMAMAARLPYILWVGSRP